MDNITGVILAGGLARRMGGVDKGLMLLNERPMISYITEILQPQVTQMYINANRNQDEYQAITQHTIISDNIEGFAGPLAGMACGLQTANTPLVAFVPCDSPFLAPDVITRLQQGLIENNADISVAHDGKRLQPVFVLMKVSLLDSMLCFLNAGERKIDKWYAQHAMVEVDFSDTPRMFININTPEEKARVLETL